VLYEIIIIIIISGPTVIERTLAASHTRGFLILLRHAVGLPWTSNQLVAKASTYTAQHRSTETNIHASSGIRTRDPSNQAAKTYALDREATGAGSMKT
jgi:hypothetical protein